MPTLAYLADPAITKDVMIAEMQAHMDADRLVAGGYWLDGRGCAVGCTIHSINARTGKRIAHGNHKVMAAMLGWPEWLVRLDDIVFENLPAPHQHEWPMRLLRAVQIGADLDAVHSAIKAGFVQDAMDAARPIASKSERWPAVESACLAVLAALRGSGDLVEARQAADTARQAANTAWLAADTARRVADTAWQAADTAWQAADTARQAADTARQAAWARIADIIIAAVEAAPVREATP